jgi:threonine synthase
MNYYSTRDKTISPQSFRSAALGGLAPDGGLYIPEQIPLLRGEVKSSLSSMDFFDIAAETIKPYVSADIPDAVLNDIVHSAYPFPAPLVEVGPFSVLELFHGPTAAFKDFGARFMARAFSYLRRGESKPLTILVATSGDTGGAVADGFFGIEGINVTVLYPKGRVTPLQEKQIAGLGKNISAIAVEGSFDDCQALVKSAFGDDELKARLDLSSANSINISRLVPQAVYYVSATSKLAASKLSGKAVFCVPSGNFGNLTAGIYAQKMGAPIESFIAATNANRTVPEYLEKGVYEPRPSLATISNAMDVGAPSNFERMQSHWTLDELRVLMRGAWVTDDETKSTIKTVWQKNRYVLDPHGAVGYAAALRLSAKEPAQNVVVIETAHPYKFIETVEPLVGRENVNIPKSLRDTLNRPLNSVTLTTRLAELKDKLMA